MVRGVASIIIVIHHTALFYLEVLRFSGFSVRSFGLYLQCFTTAFILLAERYRKGRMIISEMKVPFINRKSYCDGT